VSWAQTDHPAESQSEDMFSRQEGQVGWDQLIDVGGLSKQWHKQQKISMGSYLISQIKSMVDCVAYSKALGCGLGLVGAPQHGSTTRWQCILAATSPIP